MLRLRLRQDVSSDHRMWNSIPWKAIHGSRDNSGEKVDPDNDFRAWDGDFFRAWDVAGNIIIRDNRISDAFNAIHFFNRIDELAPGVDPKGLKYNGGRRASANILIENNTFTRIRDNAIEPEDYAWNWVVRHNVFADCYRPFSLELQRAGWFYIYGNYGWVTTSPVSTQSRRSAQVLAFQARWPAEKRRQHLCLPQFLVLRQGQGNLPERGAEEPAPTSTTPWASADRIRRSCSAKRTVCPCP